MNDRQSVSVDTVGELRRKVQDEMKVSDVDMHVTLMGQVSEEKHVALDCGIYDRSVVHMKEG